jgi:hypothetical protein
VISEMQDGDDWKKLEEEEHELYTIHCVRNQRSRCAITVLISKFLGTTYGFLTLMNHNVY